MRDLALLRFTLEAIREFGDGGAGVSAESIKAGTQARGP